MSNSWLPRMFTWIVPLMGGEFSVRFWHHLFLWFFVTFVIVHVYLAFYHDYIEGRGTISSIVGGWKFERERSRINRRCTGSLPFPHPSCETVEWLCPSERPLCIFTERTTDLETAIMSAAKTLVLGLGNILMGDEGVGVHVVRAMEKHALPAHVECLDGGTGGFILLEPLQSADRIILIDAAADGNPPGTVTRTTPRFSRDYPPTLTAHDIGVKDLLDVFYMQGGGPRGRSLRHRHRSPAAHLDGFVRGYCPCCQSRYRRNYGGANSACTLMASPVYNSLSFCRGRKIPSHE